MTIIILILICFLTVHVIHHLTVIEQLKAVKHNQFDILDLLEDHDLYLKTLEDELYNIKRSIDNITYTKENQ